MPGQGQNDALTTEKNVLLDNMLKEIALSLVLSAMSEFFLKQLEDSSIKLYSPVGDSQCALAY